jgi:hypothetical protein
MSTNISVIDEYHQSVISPPLVGFTVLGTVPPVEEAAVEDVEAPVDGVDEVEAKVVKAPARRKATPKATEGAETK